MTTSETARVQSASTESISQAVVTAVAEATGRDPTRLEPLYHAIDPDALDQLFRTPSRGFPRSNGRVVFTMADCEVTVHANGEIDVVASTDTPEDRIG